MIFDELRLDRIVHGGHCHMYFITYIISGCIKIPEKQNETKVLH